MWNVDFGVRNVRHTYIYMSYSAFRNPHSTFECCFEKSRKGSSFFESREVFSAEKQILMIFI